MFYTCFREEETRISGVNLPLKVPQLVKPKIQTDIMPLSYHYLIGYFHPSVSSEFDQLKIKSNLWSIIILNQQRGDV